ncbi:MAG: nucleotidyltransferase family protein [Myxococcales bacterium]|nr:nucleotidyltransferase family protein [Myxococcales bacterium]
MVRSTLAGVHGMVFAAGLGTRLRPLTDVLPKPVVPLMNRPLASYSLERLAAAGVTRCVLNTHYLADEVPRALEGHVPPGVEVIFSHEPELLGTGGGLRAALERLGPTDEPILVMNGDILFWPDLEAALAHHRALGAFATMILRPDPRAARFGAIETDARGRVRRILGTPADVADPLKTQMFTGVHVLSPEVVAALPQQGCVIRGGYQQWLAEGRLVGGLTDEAPWRDLGTPREYLQAHLDLLSGALPWPSIEAGEGDVVLGRGTLVDPGVELSRVVSWPGTHVTASASDAILAPHARVDVAG